MLVQIAQLLSLVAALLFWFLATVAILRAMSSANHAQHGAAAAEALIAIFFLIAARAT